MDNTLIVHTQEELCDLICILLSNDKVIRVEKTMLQNYLIAWEEPEEADE